MSGALATWIDGAEGDSVPADDRGLHYGDGVFETMLVRNGVPRFLAAHRERLRRGLVRLEIQFPDGDALEADIARAAAMAPPLAILKIVVTRGTAPRGYKPPDFPTARRIVSLWSTEPMPPEILEAGAILNISRIRLPEPSPFAGLKHLNRLENVMAATDTVGGPGFEALMLAAGGNVIGGTACNVFIVRAAEILTPRVDRAGVAGVMRQIVLREAPHMGIAAREQELTLQDLFAADAMFITNARIGVVPVQRVREHVFGMSEIVKRLRTTIEALDA